MVKPSARILGIVTRPSVLTGQTTKAILVTAFLSGLPLLLGCGKYKNDKSADHQLTALSSITGTLTLVPTGAPASGARVTLFAPDLTFFRETRSDEAGSYSFSGIPPNSYQLGVAARGWKYEELTVDLTLENTQQDLGLLPETEVGRWDIIGDTGEETFDGTDIGILRTNGTLMFCHDTREPVLFDPRTGNNPRGPDSGSEQGCTNASLLSDGSVLFAGGQEGSEPQYFTQAVSWVKRFWPDARWERLGDMNAPNGRWYPGMVRLNDGRLLVMGGGTRPSAERTNTCELFDPATQIWTWTGSLAMPLEFPPAALLYTGEVLQTWGGQPQLYNVASGQWRPTGQFNFPNRGYPDHSDHSLLVLTDGRAIAVGASRRNQPQASMTEYYDPGTGTWTQGTSPDLVRKRTEVVYLPDGQVLVGAGNTEGQSGGEPDRLGVVKRCDLLDPQSGSWRRIANMLEFREYHAVTLLIPDGRVAMTGGTAIGFVYPPQNNWVEAYSPPYLFRGVRPSLSNFSSTSPTRGETVTFIVAPDTQLTSAVLMGVQSTTHWVDAGIPRRLELAVTQAGAEASVTLLEDANRLPLGWYMFFGMVDDIPSEAQIIQVIG